VALGQFSRSFAAAQADDRQLRAMPQTASPEAGRLDHDKYFSLDKDHNATWLTRHNGIK
jgi:hypothetical protein